MNIQNLLELVEPTVSQHTYKKKFQDTIPMGSAKELGSGVYSRVVTDPNDPHMVRKHNHTPLSADDGIDAYRLFVDKLVEKGLINKNPYFPRIYNVTGIKDKDKQRINSYQMEKLLNYDDVSVEEIQAMTERIFNDTNIKNTLEKSSFENRKSEQYKLHRRITDHIEQAVERQDFQNIKDPTMVKALQALSQIIDELNSGAGEQVIIDLNPGNIMYRRTKYGLQPVISDPLA